MRRKEKSGRGRRWSLLLIAWLAAGFAAFTDASVGSDDWMTVRLTRVSQLLRQGRTVEARIELEQCFAREPSNAELYHQLARAHMLDVYQATQLPEARRSIDLALNALERALEIAPAHVAALKLKWDIHSQPKLLHYNDDLAYDLVEKISTLEASNHAFRIEAAERVINYSYGGKGASRAADLLDPVLESVRPYSSDEERALFLMGMALAYQGKHVEAIDHFNARLLRPLNLNDVLSTLRELGANYFKLGKYAEATQVFMSALEQEVTLSNQWLLRVCLGQLRLPLSKLPAAAVFPLRAESLDPRNPPLLDFIDIAGRLGLDRLEGAGTLAWADYDGDQDLDVFAVGGHTPLALYRNEKGRFVEAAASAGLGEVAWSKSLNAIDYDNDGRIDLYLARNGWHGPMPNSLYHNQADGTFEDVSAQAGLEDPGSSFVSLWGDLDNDGLLDLVVANGVLRDGSTTQVYRNNGDGTFENVTKRAGIVEPSDYGAIGIALGDYDRDGDLDLFINGWMSTPNRLYRNDGDFRFIEVAPAAGLLQAPHHGYVCFFVDYNNDAYPDLLITNLADWDLALEGLTSSYHIGSPAEIPVDSPTLFRNNRDGTFTDVTYEAKLYYPMGTMGAGVADLDNDGYVDFYFGTGDPRFWRLEPNRFFRNNGDGAFSDLTMYSRLGHLGKGHGVTFADYDEDGDLDVYAQLGAAYPGDLWRNAFYENRKGNQNNWLQVELIGTQSNRYAVGAAVVVRAGGLTVYREVKGSEGFGATDPYRQHFGLGKQTRVDSLEISWPSGRKQIFTDLKVNQLIRVRESEELSQAGPDIPEVPR